MKRVVVALLVLLCGTARAAPSPSAPSFSIATTRLANGLELVVQEDHRTPRVAVSLWYHVGSKDEPVGRNGLAHLFEHLMLEAGSRHVEPGAFLKTLESAGATNIQCTTSVDRTNYREVVPASALEVALWLESDRMAFLLDRIDARVLDAQKTVIANERKASYDDAPLRLVEQMIHGEVFPVGHPNHRASIGDPTELARATLDDAREFFRAWYAPNNATLVLSGDIDMTRARSLVEKWFGAISSRSLASRSPIPAVNLAGDVRLEIETQLADRYVIASWPTPPTYTSDDAELAIVQRVLSSGRLQRVLRDDLSARIVSVTSSRPTFGQFGNLFSITAIAGGAQSATDVLAAIDGELARMRSGEISDAEIGEAKTALLSERMFGVERLFDRSERINEYAQFLGSPSFFDGDRRRIDAVTRASVVAAILRWLPSDRRVVALVTPNTKMSESARLVRVGRVGTVP